MRSGLREQSLDLRPGVRTRADEHRGFVDLVVGHCIKTLPPMDARETQQRIGGLDRSPAAPIEHEAPSHRNLGSREIVLLLGSKSARQLNSRGHPVLAERAR